MKISTWESVRKVTEGKAFNRVGAWVIINPAGDICGTVKVLYPSDGAGKLSAVLHEHGYNPQTGYASGYGYDKLSAALSGGVFGQIILKDSGREWQNQFNDAGFKVYQAV